MDFLLSKEVVLIESLNPTRIELALYELVYNPNLIVELKGKTIIYELFVMKFHGTSLTYYSKSHGMQNQHFAIHKRGYSNQECIIEEF